MRVTRFHTTSDGGSAFDEVDIPLTEESMDAWGNRLRLSAAFASPAVRLFDIPAGAFQDWHNAPRRQLCVMLEGVWEVCTSDGQKRRWHAGEMFLPDDVDGRGHTSEAIEGPVRIVFVPLPEDLDLSLWRVV